jgi:hypothetical protein
MGQGNPTENSIIQLSRDQKQGSYQSAVKDRPAYQRVMPALRTATEPALRHAGRLGTLDQNLKRVLVQVHIKAELIYQLSRSRIEEYLNKATYQQPAIVLLKKPAHFIICDGPSAIKTGGFWGGKRHWIFCDPDYPNGTLGQAYYGRMDGAKVYFHNEKKTRSFSSRISSIISIGGVNKRKPRRTNKAKS